MSGYYFDQLIKDGKTTEALRYFAKEGYENGVFGHTRKQLIESSANQIQDKQATIDSLSMAHDNLQRELADIKSVMPLDKHTLIKNLITRNREIDNLKAYVDEHSKKSTELNVFLQKRNTAATLGMHVIDSIMNYVQELEEYCDHIYHQYGLEAEQNRRYREAIDSMRLHAHYPEIIRRIYK